MLLLCLSYCDQCYPFENYSYNPRLARLSYTFSFNPLPCILVLVQYGNVFLHLYIFWFKIIYSLTCFACTNIFYLKCKIVIIKMKFFFTWSDFLLVFVLLLIWFSPATFILLEFFFWPQVMFVTYFSLLSLEFCDLKSYFVIGSWGLF